MKPLVSVCMTTYNHAPYIAQALESILAQRTSFGVEIVVGDDCSQDGTAEIVSHYVSWGFLQARIPEWVAIPFSRGSS